jgi:hypothetical protein
MMLNHSSFKGSVVVHPLATMAGLVGWTKVIAGTTQRTNVPTFLYRNNHLSRSYVLMETVKRK